MLPRKGVKHTPWIYQIIVIVTFRKTKQKCRPSFQNNKSILCKLLLTKHAYSLRQASAYNANRALWMTCFTCFKLAAICI